MLFFLVSRGRRGGLLMVGGVCCESPCSGIFDWQSCEFGLVRPIFGRGVLAAMILVGLEDR